MCKEGLKICNKCGDEKILSDFRKNNGMKDGHLKKCKECAKKDDKKNHKKVYEKRKNRKKDFLIKEKQCYICKKTKSLDEFHNYVVNVDGKQSACKICRSQEGKKINKTEKRKNYMKIYTKKDYVKKNKKANSDKYIKSQKGKEKRKNYYKNNKKTIQQKNKIYDNNRRLNDLIYKMGRDIQALIGVSLRKKGFSKKSRTAEILGCDYETFKNYIESQFYLEKNLDENGSTWMTWENHGKYTGNLNETWQYDHIIPLSSAKNEKDLIKLNHYTNLQALCSFINQNIKRNKLSY